MIRAEITKVINDGIVDGDNLNHAFKEIQTEKVESFSATATDILINFSTSFREKLSDLIEEIRIQENLKYESVDFNLKEKLKWEKGAKFALNAGGAVGAALGAKAAASALVIFGSNPAGWAVAAVGIAIIGIASLFGWGLKKSVQSKRKEDAKKAIYPKIDEIGLNLRKAIFSKIDDLVNSAESQLRELSKNKREEIRALRNEVRKPIQSESISDIEGDIELISSSLSKI